MLGDDPWMLRAQSNSLVPSQNVLVNFGHTHILNLQSTDYSIRDIHIPY